MVFEWFVMMFMLVIFVSYGLFYTNIVLVHQDAMQLEEYAIMLIEHHNGYDDYVNDELARVNTNQKIHLQIRRNDNGESIAYQIYVTYKVNNPFSNKPFINTLYSMTKS